MITKDRQYRHFEMRVESENNGTVEGYAATFNSPTVLFTDGETEYKETIDARAFDKCDMSDVVMNYNHSGKPVARTRNKTLSLSVDDKGLFITADLTGTAEGRNMLEEIRGGYIDKMSFCFTVSEEEYDRTTHTRTLKGINKLYDVAAVDRPAYESTSISARSFFEAEAEREKAEAVAEATRQAKIDEIRTLLEV